MCKIKIIILNNSEFSKFQTKLNPFIIKRFQFRTRISRQKKNEIKQLNIARIKRNIKYALFEARAKSRNHFSSKQREFIRSCFISSFQRNFHTTTVIHLSAIPQKLKISPSFSPTK